MSFYFYIIFWFLFGLAIGSFLNVLIYRIPRGISIIKPGSFCPQCHKPILWYENIPVLSYLFLKGRCSGCKKKISVRYPIVEIFMGITFLILFYRYQLGYNFLFYCFFFSCLVVVSGIDFSHQVIPNVISVPGIFAGIVLQFINGNPTQGIIGVAFGGGLMLFIRYIGGWAYKQEVMGFGDVTLTAMIGAFIGFPLIIPAVFIAALIGSIFGVCYIISTHQSRETPIPFGPFLSLGGMVSLIFHSQLVQVLAIMGIYL